MPNKRQTDQAASQEDFWRGKTPCWELARCPNPILNDCPAYRYRQYPCWEIEGTYCKWGEWGTLGQDTSTCLICQVYLRYGEGQRIKLKLQRRGIRLLIKSR